MLKSFLLAIQFLTVFPIKVSQINENKLAQSAIFFPLVGLLLGGFLIGVNNILYALNLQRLSIDIIIVISLVILTGGIHLDGLSDTLDGLLSRKAKDETLIKRFSETRRRHPLSQGALTVAESIARERELLGGIGESGHHIDTSELSPNTLRSWIKNLVDVDRSRLTLLFVSFGFKQGIPLDADFVFDVRCLPNPYYEPALRELTGLDAAVAAFLEANESTQNMYRDIHAFIATWLPAFVRENRSYLTVAIGCTGGRHRSVYFAERLGAAFSADNQVMIRHRQVR